MRRPPTGAGPAPAPAARGASGIPPYALLLPSFPLLRGGVRLTDLLSRLRALTPEVLQGIRRGIEKESLRVRPGGKLALTPHPAGLGAGPTHPHTTPDFRAAQVPGF